ncbi:DUF3556 domain-containing protein [Williamsia sp.]|uniref:DUF3556 domain-containing protein n=1 Tax=Williamsia sp. TaxID=1872085 RepID=UPI001A34BCDE|nr:DUF3556 domain-containing protein [Williamsia sp.]MBJ7288765.1 DUF3556 domain-containing protein [Williamsia sp.]
MGFLRPDLPVWDMAAWSAGSRSERIRPAAAHLARRGFGVPDALYVFYVTKIALYVLGGIGVALATTGIDGFTDIGSWWSEPIVFQKIVVFSLLFEVLGLGCGFGPLNNRYFPPMGSPLYWLRPGTIRLPPWPRIPLTSGTARTPFDVLLYAALLGAAVWALASDGTGSVAALDTTVGVLPVTPVAVMLGVLAVLGLRDKVIFLACRGEIYATLSVTFLFAAVDMIVAAKLIFLVIWVAAATSKVNPHLPFVMSTMLSNSPTIRPTSIKKRCFRSYPDDLRPSRLSAMIAHAATAVEMGVPLFLFFSGGGIVTTVAATVMIAFHLGILSSIPMGAPLEWNVFMIIGIGILFVGHAETGLADVSQPIPVFGLFAVVVAVVVAGNLFPQKISFLPGMRYYAGNWDTTMWCMKPSASAKLTGRVKTIAIMPQAQLEKMFGAEQAVIQQHLGYAFRAMNTHGRALFTLVHRAIADGDEADYVIVDGERICSTAIGWNFGDGHMHNETLIAALQERCAFDPGEVRVILLDAQPIHRRTQQYRLVDPATGEFERGSIRVADMVSAQPWADDLPVDVQSGASTAR